MEVLRANPAAAVRQDAHNHYYLYRNLHLPNSAGRTVGLGLYGLNTEQAVEAQAHGHAH